MDPTGSVVNSYAYDPFGVSLGKSEGVLNPFEYVGEFGVMNEGNGLEFMRARFYAVDTSHFLQQDPIGIRGGANLYEYTHSSPVERIDPNGTYALLVVRLLPFIHWVVENWEQLNELYDIGEYTITNIVELVELIQGYEWDHPNDGDPGKNRTRNEGTLPNDPVDPEQFEVHKRTSTANVPPNHTGLDGGDVIQKVYQWFISISVDPNDKLAPIGFGDDVFVADGAGLAYQIRFENLAEALAPAQKVIVTDVLDEVR